MKRQQCFNLHCRQGQNRVLEAKGFQRKVAQISVVELGDKGRFPSSQSNNVPHYYSLV